MAGMARTGRRNLSHGLQGHTKRAPIMAKAQKRSTREIRKPKADKNKTTPVVGLSPGTQVNALMNKPKAKA